MRRREFLGALGGAAVAWPVVARAQQSAMPVVGLLQGRSPDMAAHLSAAVREGLREAGFVEGRNVAIEYRYASGQYDKFPALVAELIERKISVLIAGAPSGQVAKSATSTIPVVFVGGGDPVRGGLVASLGRPGGNVTGISMISGDLESKRFGLLRELVPQAAVLGALIDDNNPPQETEFRRQEMQAAGRRLGLSVKVFGVRSEPDFGKAFTELVRERARGLVVTGSTFFNNNRERLVELAARHGIPAIYELREFTAAGGLMSYAPNLTNAFRQGGIYAGRVLKGEKPADLPVLLPTKFEFVINLKTAKTLGLTIPSGVLSIADEVIE